MAIYRFAALLGAEGAMLTATASAGTVPRTDAKGGKSIFRQADVMQPNRVAHAVETGPTP